MANPKRRHSKARKNRRRSHDHLAMPAIAECPHCHETKMPHQACPHCGYYNAQEVMLVKETA